MCYSFEMETRTSNVVTLSFSTPIGEIFVTCACKFLVFERFHGDPRRLTEIDLADVALIGLAFDIDFVRSPRVMIRVALGAHRSEWN